MKVEVWKDIEGFEGQYQVSDQGRVKSLPRWKRKKERILKPYTNGKGYLQVGLRRDRKVQMYLVHRLVMLHFDPIENPEECDVNHINFDVTKNTFENLEWCTRQENSDHYWKAVKQGRSRKDYKGVNQHLSVLNEDSVKEIRRLYDSKEITNKSELGRLFNIAEGTVRQVLRRETWKDVD